ncbi:MAG: tyrosine-type recombinase/integrase [Polymorphobacter sp.]|uniref:tyrosine-type recombinase/integrase n=1 Tax=Polymorphobacter sp. TaxID=1909290 RepID=UPI003A8B09D5
METRRRLAGSSCAVPKLTKRSVEKLPAFEHDYIVFDSDVNGFGVRVLPSGRRSYLVQYRSGGRTRRIAIGQHGAVTVEGARKRAKELLGSVAAGQNPAEVIALHRGAPTVASVGERFMREHVAVRCKPSTEREYRRALDLFIYPAMRNHKIVDVVRADIAKLHHSARHIPYQANRTLGVLSKLFTLCEIWGLRPDGSNPCRHVPKYREEKRERFLSPEELRRLGGTLARLEIEGEETVFVIAAFRLLLFTGCRLGEIQSLQWSYVAARYLELPDSKTGARRIPLPPAARAVLDALPREAGNPFVILGAVPGQAITDLQRPWRRIRAEAGLDDVRIHDLRHTYASNAVANGMPIQMVGKLLGHTQLQTTMRYAHLADDPILRAAERNAAALSDALVGA